MKLFGTTTVVRLPPNRQWDQRAAVFQFVTDLIGTLEVLEADSTSGKKQKRRYAVRVEGTGPEDGGVMFRCTKPGGKDSYTVTVGHDVPELDSCDCPAGTMRADEVPCTHKSALLGLLMTRR